MKKRYIEMIGKKYGRLRVYGLKYGKDSRVYAECICDCGKRKDIYAISILSGRSSSCGCKMVDERSLASEVDVIGRCREIGVSAYAREVGVSRETVYKEIRRRSRNGQERVQV